MQAVRQRAEQLASALPPLLVAAERIAATVAQGVHGRRRTGTGDSFWQFRSYQSGDDAGAIDWRQSAKRDRLYIRQNEWEAAESIWLWLDGSPSMAWSSGGNNPLKGDRASLLLLAFGALLVRGGERIALLGSDRNPASGKPALDRLVSELMHNASGRDSLPPKRELPRFARLVLVSDFLSPLTDIEATIRFFAGQGVTGHLLQIHDPAELDLPYSGRVRFEGLEGEGSHIVPHVETMTAAWRRRLEARREMLTALCRRVGWGFTLHRTDTPPQSALLSLYVAHAGARALGGAAGRVV